MSVLTIDPHTLLADTVPLSPPVSSTTAGADASADRRVAVETFVRDAEEAVERHEYEAAVAVLAGNRPSATDYPDLALRALCAEAWARMYLGELQEAVELLERARTVAHGVRFDASERADVLYRLGCCRFLLSNVGDAVSLFAVALELCDRSALPCDRLRADILERRSRCYQSQRDFAAARADIERALELAERTGDDRTIASVYFQASIVAEREKQWIVARVYAEEALERCRRLGDHHNAHKALNNLGGINFLLGDVDQATTCLKEAFRIALELGSDVGAAYSMSSLAQVQLRNGQAPEAEQHARQALELLAGRDDHLNEVGNAQLVLGRSLLEQDRHDEAEQWLRAADASFERLASVSHRAAAVIALGDLAARRGDKDTAAERYRSAAESLQDFHF